MASETRFFHDDFERFCSTAAAEAESARGYDYDDDDDDDIDSYTVDDFATAEYENPMVWYREDKLSRSVVTNDVLFDNAESKNRLLALYDRDRPLPEYVKWKVYGYNIVICFEYIFKRKPDMALEIIDDIENLLESIGSDDLFLRSIRKALDHVTFSMKGHILKLCLLDTELANFFMPNDMNIANKAGLLGIKSLFLKCCFGLHYIHFSIESVGKAILLNETEAEWHYLMSRILLLWTKTGSLRYSYHELHSSKMAVKFGSSDNHKVTLVILYFRTFLTSIKKVDDETRNHYLEAGIKLLNELMETNDIVLLKYTINSVSKVTYSTEQKTINTLEVLEKLIDKLQSINNDYVHLDIGRYYLLYKKDYEKALFHLKKALDVNCFFGSINYVLMFFKIYSTNAPLEDMLTDMLNKFPHPVHQEKILSQIVSYNIITKNDIIGALKYIPMLLRLKNIACVYNLQFHKIKFHKAAKFMPKFSLIDVLSENLNAGLMKQTLSIDNQTSITEILQLLKSYKEYSLSKLLKHKVCIFNKDSNFHVKNNELQEVRMPCNKLDRTCVNTVDEGNWKTLKPTYVLNFADLY